MENTEKGIEGSGFGVGQTPFEVPSPEEAARQAAEFAEKAAEEAARAQAELEEMLAAHAALIEKMQADASDAEDLAVEEATQAESTQPEALEAEEPPTEEMLAEGPAAEEAVAVDLLADEPPAGGLPTDASQEEAPSFEGFSLEAPRHEDPQAAAPQAAWSPETAPLPEGFTLDARPSGKTASFDTAPLPQDFTLDARPASAASSQKETAPLPSDFTLNTQTAAVSAQTGSPTAGGTASNLEEAIRAADVSVPEYAVVAPQVPQEGVASSLEAAAKAADVAGSAATASEPASKPKKKGKKWLWAILAIVAVAGIAVAVFFVSQSRAYEHATELFEQGNYPEAAEEFQKLGGYKDSVTMAEKARGWQDAIGLEVEAESANTEEAWLAAASAYELIDDEEAQHYAAHCRDVATYCKARALIDAKPTDRKSAEEAYPLFMKVRHIEDAAQRAAYCENVMEYYEAGDLFDEGRYYEAYQAYLQVSDDVAKAFGDLDAKTKACIQSTPDNGVVWRNGSYPGDECELTIENDSDSNVYYKLYIGDNLVITVFIRSNAEAVFTLPSGTYSMNKAYGDTWFGKDDMFGDEGEYYKCDFGGSKTVEIEYGNAYIISAGEGGTGIGTESAGRDAI